MLVEFVVAVMKQILGLDLLLVKEDANASRLLGDPISIRASGDATQMNLARFKMYEEENEAVSDAEFGENLS